MHERMGNSWVAWLAWAFALEEAEVSLGDRTSHWIEKGQVVMPMLLCVRAMLLGYALECCLKALWVKRGNKLIHNGKYEGVKGANDHDLVQLAQATGFTAKSNDMDVLRILSKFIRFAGRYPVAKTTNEMKPDGLTQEDVGFFSKQDFRVAESILNRIVSEVTGKKRRLFPRRPRMRL